MLSLSTVPGGPLAGLPTFILTVAKGDPLPSLDYLNKEIEPYIPPIMHFILRLESPKTTDALSLVQSLLFHSLHVSVEAFGTVDPWMLGCSSTFLFTEDHMTKEHAHNIIFVTDEPPTRWRPDPWHVSKGTALYWYQRGANRQDVARLPTGMRLWWPFDHDLGDLEDEGYTEDDDRV